MEFRIVILTHSFLFTLIGFNCSDGVLLSDLCCKHITDMFHTIIIVKNTNVMEHSIRLLKVRRFSACIQRIDNTFLHAKRTYRNNAHRIFRILDGISNSRMKSFLGFGRGCGVINEGLITNNNGLRRHATNWAPRTVQWKETGLGLVLATPLTIVLGTDVRCLEKPRLFVSLNC